MAGCPYSLPSPVLPHLWQILNKGSKDLQILKVFGRPPIGLTEYDKWNDDEKTMKGKELESGYFDRKCLPGSFFGGRFANKPTDLLV